eukprot:4080980-Amphidinium_carterae.1
MHPRGSPSTATRKQFDFQEGSSLTSWAKPVCFLERPPPVGCRAARGYCSVNSRLGRLES